jgi:hypothetical protein
LLDLDYQDCADAITRIRERVEWQATPTRVIALTPTGGDCPEADGQIAKPIRFEDLKSEIERVMGAA